MLNVRIKTTTKKTARAELDRKTLVKIIRAAGGGRVPKDAEVTITVPSGGDYSGMTLPIDDCNLVVTWQEVEQDDGAQLSLL